MKCLTRNMQSLVLLVLDSVCVCVNTVVRVRGASVFMVQPIPADMRLRISIECRISKCRISIQLTSVPLGFDCKCQSTYHHLSSSLPRGLGTHNHWTGTGVMLAYRRTCRSGSRARSAQLASCRHACGGAYLSTRRRRRLTIRHTTLGICLARSIY